MSDIVTAKVTPDEDHYEIIQVASVCVRNLMVLHEPRYALDACAIMVAEILRNTAAYDDPEQAAAALEGMKRQIDARWRDQMEARKEELS